MNAMTARGADSYEMKPIKWLWKGRLPLGKITLLAGEPEAGKTFLVMAMASYLTTGRRWPDEEPDAPRREPIDCLIVGAEDDPCDTVIPRLMAMKAAIGQDGRENKIWLATHARNLQTGQEEFFNLKTHLPNLDRFLEVNPQVKLVVFDPLEAFMGEANTFKNSDVRGILDPLAEIMAKREVALLGIHHLNKKDTEVAQHRIMGSTAYAAVSRMIWLVHKDREDQELVKMVRIKGNICKVAPGLGYRIQGITVRNIAGEEVETAVVLFDERRIYESPDDMLSMTAEAKKKPGLKAKAWLRKFLEPGPQLVTFIKASAKQAGINWRTLQRAREELKVDSKAMEVNGQTHQWWGFGLKMKKKGGGT